MDREILYIKVQIGYNIVTPFVIRWIRRTLKRTTYCSRKFRPTNVYIYFFGERSWNNKRIETEPLEIDLYLIDRPHLSFAHAETILFAFGRGSDESFN